MEWLCRDMTAFSAEALERALETLSPSRKEHILRLRRQEDRARSLAGELLARELLQKLGITGATLHRAANGQPWLTGCEKHISIAHCDQKVACAVSEDPVGIDIERIRPIKRQLLRHVCVEEEARYVLGEYEGEDLLQQPEVLQRFFEIWTGKEAYFKKQGTGITDLKAVNILPMKRQMYLLDGYMLQII